jgi:hypothetical protein
MPISGALLIAMYGGSAMNDDIALPGTGDQGSTVVPRPGASAAARRELERARRAEAARITSLVRYMLNRELEPPSTKAARR